MKYLLIGGAGFIGSYIYNELNLNTNKGHEPFILDNLDCYGIMSPGEYNTLLEDRIENADQNISKVDINNRDAVTRYVNALQPDVVIHLAAYPRAALVEKYPVQGVSTMTVGLKNVLDACAGIAKHFVYISSSMVYGDFPEWSPNEMDACHPKSAYGVYKLAGEQMVQNWSMKTGATCTIIRPSAVYGPKDVTERVISLFFDAALQDEELYVEGAGEMLDFTYVADVSQAITYAAQHHVQGTFNVTGGDPRSLLDAAEIITGMVGGGTIRVKPRNADQPKRGGLDMSLAKETLYLNQTKFEVGLNWYYGWLRDR